MINRRMVKISFLIMGMIITIISGQPQSHNISPSVNIDIGEMAINSFILENIPLEYSFDAKSLINTSSNCISNLGPFKPLQNVFEIGSGSQKFELKIVNLSFDFEEGTCILNLGLKIKYELNTTVKEASISFSRTLKTEDLSYDVSLKKIRVCLGKVMTPISRVTGYYTKSADGPWYFDNSVQPMSLVDLKTKIKPGDHVSLYGDKGEVHYRNASVFSFIGGYGGPYVLAQLGYSNQNFIAGQSVSGTLYKVLPSLGEYLNENYGSIPEYIRSQIKNKFNQIELYSKDLLMYGYDYLPLDRALSLPSNILTIFDQTALQQQILSQSKLKQLQDFVESGVYKFGTPSQILAAGAVTKIDELFKLSSDFNEKNLNSFLTYYTAHTTEFVNLPVDVKNILEIKIGNFVQYTQQQRDYFKTWVETNEYLKVGERIATKIKETFNDASDYTNDNIAYIYNWNKYVCQRLDKNSAIFWDERLTIVTFSFKDDYLRLSVSPHLEFQEPWFQVQARQATYNSKKWQFRIVSNSKYNISELAFSDGQNGVNSGNGVMSGDEMIKSNNFQFLSPAFTTQVWSVNLFYHCYLYNERQLISISGSVFTGNLSNANGQWVNVGMNIDK